MLGLFFSILAAVLGLTLAIYPQFVIDNLARWFSVEGLPSKNEKAILDQFTPPIIFVWRLSSAAMAVFSFLTSILNPVSRRFIHDRWTGLWPTPNSGEETNRAPTASSILQTLQNQGASWDRLSHAVIDAEALEFTVDQESALKPLLRKFIDKERFATANENLIALGSAIRSYGALLKNTELESVAELLQPLDAIDVAPQVELEVAMMVLRKLTAAPPDNLQFPNLSSKLADLVEAYCYPRVLGRSCIGATVLNSILASALIRDDAWERVKRRVEKLDVPWFRQQLARRAKKLREELKPEFSSRESVVSNLSYLQSSQSQKIPLSAAL